jgi:hypothetical protein
MTAVTGSLGRLSFCVHGNTLSGEARVCQVNLVRSGEEPAQLGGIASQASRKAYWGRRVRAYLTTKREEQSAREVHPWLGEEVLAVDNMPPGSWIWRWKSGRAEAKRWIWLSVRGSSGLDHPTAL